jgi:hypothetical protein
MLSTTLITFITILERLLASGTLTAALAAIFKKALSALGVYSVFYFSRDQCFGQRFFSLPKMWFN